MFTGIVRHLVTLEKCEKVAGVLRWWLSCDFVKELKLGDSVMHNGVCLTVSDLIVEDSQYVVEIIPETLRVTTLADFRPGQRLHAELALKVGDRLDGHMVSGHVDTTSEVSDVLQADAEYQLRIVLTEATAPFVAAKGSITIDGVSLTVVEAAADYFVVALIPETLVRTLLKDLRPGDKVNLEWDLVTRYLARFRELSE